jgi:hypothetical protein
MVKPNFLNALNMARMKDIAKAKLARTAHVNPLLLMGGVAGVGLVLFSQRNGSKKQNQGGW